MTAGIRDAEFEVLRDPLPGWARELIEKQTGRNWKAIKEELLSEK